MTWLPHLIMIFAVFGGLLGCVHVLVYVERRVCAGIQSRLGPNLVGPFGFLQPLADAVKMIFKEDIVPNRADKFLYILAPLFVVIPPFIAFTAIPFGDMLGTMQLQIAPTGLDLLVILSVLSLTVFGIAFGAWASNNKYALLGGLRSSAQIISYELALGLSILAVIVLTGEVSTREVVKFQINYGWNFLWMPFVALLFFTAALAENNRLPFDMAECEAELVGGYHTEYASLKFAMFFMGEYVSVVVMSALFTTLFLGGWHAPWLTEVEAGTVVQALLGVGAFVVKTAVVIFFVVVIRWTLPRVKYQQLMQFGWKFLLPLALVNIVAYGVFRVL